ncbi:MAG: hypothetical protein ACRBBP_02750 [Bdellovibrionales bacterium]
MKKTLLSLSLVFTATAFANGKAGDVFYPKNIKETVCKKAYQAFHREVVSVKKCESATFTFAEDKVAVVLEGVKKPLTTQMSLAFDIEGASFKAVVNAVLEVTAKGTINRTGWEVISISPAGFDDEAILRSTWNGVNVVEIAVEDLPELAWGQMADYVEKALDELEGGEDFKRVSKQADAEISGGEEWEVILHPETGKAVGYMTTGKAASESLDVREVVTFKFDAKGKIFERYQEGYGYWE